jgi:hypothetical protein
MHPGLTTHAVVVEPLAGPVVVCNFAEGNPLGAGYNLVNLTAAPELRGRVSCSVCLSWLHA